MRMIEIKPLLPDQWQLLKAIRCAALQDAPYAYSSTLESASKRSDEDWVQLTLQYVTDPNSITFFAFEDEISCGMSACAIDGERAEMFAVWVDPAHRRKGVGRALIKYAREWSVPHGARQLKVGVYDDNPTAMAFYQAMGFRDTGFTKPELSTESRSVILLTLSL